MILVLEFTNDTLSSEEFVSFLKSYANIEYMCLGEDKTSVDEKKLILKLSSQAYSEVVIFADHELVEVNKTLISKFKVISPNSKIYFASMVDLLHWPRVLLRYKKVDGIFILENELDKTFLITELLSNKDKIDYDNFLFLENDHIVLSRDKRKSISIKGEKKTLSVFATILPSWGISFAPCGLAYIISSLRNNNYHVVAKDFNLEFWKTLKKSDWKEYESLDTWCDLEVFNNQTIYKIEHFLNNVVDEIIDSGCQVAAFSIFHTSEKTYAEVARRLRQRAPEIKLVTGGPSSVGKLVDDYINQNFIDAAVLGEGEEAFVELLDNWCVGDFEKPVGGVAIKAQDGKIIKNMVRKQADINSLPVPDYSDFNIYNYLNHKLPIFFSRGCIARCTFCYETNFWKKFRIKKPTLIVDEMEYNIKNYNINTFSINDSLMNGSHKLLEKIADTILERKLKVRYHGYCRVDKRMTKELLQKLRESGCEGIAYGVETGSQKVLDSMRKGTKVSEATPLLKRTFDVGMNITVFIMVAFPGETLIDFCKTLLLLYRNRKYIDQANITAFMAAPMTDTEINPDQYELQFDKKRDKLVSTEFWNNPQMRHLKFKIIHKFWNLIKKNHKRNIEKMWRTPEGREPLM